MVENLNEQKSSAVANKKPQNMKNRKKLLLRLIAVICAVSLAVGVFFLYQIWKDNQPLKIGDVEISKEKIQKNSNELSRYLKDNPDISYGKGSPEEIVSDDLIMNAALRDYSKRKCQNKTFTNLDLYHALNYDDTISENDAKTFIEKAFQNKGDFERIRIENIAMKNNLYPCVNKVKEFYSVSTIFDSPYFIESKSQSEFDEKINTAKNKLQTMFMDRFKNGENRDAIDKDVEVGYKIRGKERLWEYDFNIRPTIFSNLMKWAEAKDEAGYYQFNDIENIKYGSHSLKTVSMNSVARSMNKVGEVKGVNIGADGEISIMRLESISGGEFNNWDEFLKHYKDKLQMEDKKAYAADYHDTGIIIGPKGVRYSVRGWGGLHPNGNYYSAKESCSSNGVAHTVMFIHKVRVRGQAGYLRTPGVVHAQTHQGLRGGGGGLNCATESEHDNTSDGELISMYNCSLGGDGRGTLATLSITINGAYTSKYRVVSKPSHSIIYSGNNTWQTGGEVIIEKKEEPYRETYPSNATTSSQADTKVAVKLNGSSSPIAQNSSEWQTSSPNSPIVAPVGSHVSFKHEVTGNASSNNNQGNVSVNWNTTGSNKAGLATSGSGNLGTRHSGLAVRQGNTTQTKNNNYSSNSSFRVSNADVGKIICDNIRGTIRHSHYRKVISGVRDPETKRKITQNESWELEGTDDRTATSNQSCVYVPYEFELVPCIKAGNANCGGTDIPVEPGTNTPVVPRITGTGTPTPPNSRWIITRWKIPGNFEGNPETPKERRDNNNGNTCSHYNNEFGGHARECNSGQMGTGSFTGNPPTVINTGDIGVPNDAELGARYCIGLSISPYKMERNESQAAQNAKVGRDWRHSAPICVLVTKKPKMQVWSNGVYSRGGIKTSRSEIGGNSFGSWVEFEAIGGRTITGFRTESSQNTSNLTFRNGIANSTGRNSNATDRGNWGQWGSSNNVNHLIESLKARYPKSDASRNVHVEGNSNLNANIGGFTNTGTRIYYAKDATITGNIINSEPRSNGGNFAQTIIIANNINISKDVTRVDAWLIASNEINTCPVGKRNVNESNCGKQLTVNGPLIARSLNSWRTAGSTPTDRKAPAEIYNQRADVYLWAYGQSGGVGRIITTYTKELPVRY